LKYIVKSATNMEGTVGWGVCVRNRGLYWYDTQHEAKTEACILELKHLQEKMDKVLETLGELDPHVDPRDYLA
jgi:hypothetical protein